MSVTSNAALEDRFYHFEDELVRLHATLAGSRWKTSPKDQPSYMGMHGARLLNNGFHILPVRRNSKIPLVNEWQRLREKPREQARNTKRFKNASVGIDTTNTPAIDLDCNDSDLVAKLRAEILQKHGKTPERVGRIPRLLLPFRTASPFLKVVSAIWTDQKNQEHKLEVLGRGQQFVSYGYHPDTQQPYTWYLDGEPSGLTRLAEAELPFLSQGQAEAWARRFDELAAARGWKRKGLSAGLAGAESQFAHTESLDVSMEDLAEIVAKVPRAEDYERWVHVGMAIHYQTRGSAEGLSLWHDWSSSASNYDRAGCEAKWQSFGTEGRKNFLTARALYAFAGMSTPPGAALTGSRLTEDSIASAFAQLHNYDLCFDHQTGHWMTFDDTRWKEEKTQLAFDYARAICRHLLRKCSDPKTISALSRASAAAAVEKFARADRTFARDGGWNADPMLLGTPDGTVDLTTGVLRSACRRDYITMSTGVAPLAEIDAPADMPVFWNFLMEVTSGDGEVIQYLQRFGGYCLTGITREQILLFIHGPGGNGKSILQSTLQHVLGDYAGTAPPEMFISSRSERHPTELASLNGKRLVVASENENNKAWSEVRIKQLTGGDKIVARKMRQDFFEFENTAKFFFVGNNRPAITLVDDAMRRRFHVLQFAFKPVEPDKTLFERLKKEGPAILRWLIDGCLEWQLNGLQAPLALRSATQEYFDEQDVIQEWLDECFDFAPHLGVTNQGLRASFESFARGRGTQETVNPLEALRIKGFIAIKNTHGIRGRGYAGLSLRADALE